MAPFDQTSYMDNSKAPQSSMIATHVKNGHGVPHLNQDNFAQLLEESLGQDEKGRPNLNDDVGLNNKLILVVIQVGLDPELSNDIDNPFRSLNISGRSVTQLKQCLAVLQLAIARTKTVLFHTSDQEQGNNGLRMPLYTYMVPKLLSVMGRADNPEITTLVLNIFQGALETQNDATINDGDAIVVFFQVCLSGLIAMISSAKDQDYNSILMPTKHGLTHSVPRHSDLYEGLQIHLAVLSLQQYVSIACLMINFLSKRRLSKCDALHVKKHRAKLEPLLDHFVRTWTKTNVIKSLNSAFQTQTVVSIQDYSSFSFTSNEDGWLEEDRARKRPRLSSELDGMTSKHSLDQQVIHQLTSLLSGLGTTDMDGFSSLFPTRFRTLSEEEQCQLLEQLGFAACQLYSQSVHGSPSCIVCDESNEPTGNASEPAQLDELFKALAALKSVIQRRKKLRIYALSALRRLASHAMCSNFLRLKGSIIGEWCLQSLRASTRDVKMVAARTLQSFICTRPGREFSIVHENRVAALEFLQALWNDTDVASLEVVILTLSQMAQIAEDEELNIILLRFVDYLGHRNPYVCGTVYSELQQLAQQLQVSTSQLFRPFWSTIGLVVVKNFHKRPEIAVQLSDLMGVQLEGLLQIIEEHVLPYLIFSQDRKLIERIGTATGSPMSPFDLCTKLNNLPRILAFLLSQSFQDPEKGIMTLLVNISEDFREQDLTGWINHNPIQVACELLEAIGDVGQGKVSKTYQGLQHLAQLTQKRSSHGANTRRSDSTSSFLESHALAIVTRFSVKLNEGAIRESNVEKRRCLVALGEIVRLGKSRVKVALPHICACLRAAMEDRNLCNAAFSSWNTMMLNLGEAEIRDLISQTFAMIVKGWDLLDMRNQENAYNLVANLLKQYQTLVRSVFDSLPSLNTVPMMAKFESEITALKRQNDERNQVTAFIGRMRDENSAVVEQALAELVPVLREKHDFLQRSILREQPELFIEDLERTILDASVKFASNANLLLYTAQCLGALGCLDPSKVENTREKKRFVLTSNFAKAEETTAFLMFFMEEVLVAEYVSTSNLREKGFLAWSLQQLLAFCDLPADIATRSKTGSLTAKDKHWFDLSETTRLILTPFLTSKFVSSGKKQKAKISYPFFKPGMTYKYWLTEVTLDFLNKAAGDNVDMIFDVCCRLVSYGQGIAIPSFLFPYAVLHLVLSGTEQDKSDVVTEIRTVLLQSLNGLDIEQQDQIKQCSQSVFDVLDYMSLWLQETRKQVAQVKIRVERGISDPALERGQQQIEQVSPLLGLIPPNVTTQRAIECRSYARALFHQEQYINSLGEVSDSDYRRLQNIYEQIDEPDGIEGISAQIKFLDVESEVMEHKKAGRWNTAQSWYEMKLVEHPDDFDIQVNLMKCLKESGQHDVLIHHFDGITGQSERVNPTLLPFAIEASWVMNRWDKLSDYLLIAPKGDFAVDLGKVFTCIKNSDHNAASVEVDKIFRSAASDLTPNNTSSFQACHESLLKVHILEDIRVMLEAGSEDRGLALVNVNKRLSILGSCVADQQYLLGIHRAMMHLRPAVFRDEDIASSWLTSARLARKALATGQAFNSILRASSLGDKSAAIEQAKIMWQEGHHRKAIQTLEGAIESGALSTNTTIESNEAVTVDSAPEERNEMTAKAYVLLGKWLDQAGQTQSDTIIKTFRKSTEQNRRWEKGWYNLGRHYNKILESEKLKPVGKESQPFLTGEIAKLVIDNFLRALATGNKYLFQTLPKVLTLWLELVGGGNQEHDARRGNTQFHIHNLNQRKKIIADTNASVKKYMERIPVYALYTILPQLVARICHADQTVNEILQMMIVKVVRSFPQQALWTVLATVKSSSKDRATRGLNLIRKTVENAKKDLKVFTLPEMREFITSGQKFSDELLRIADFEIQGRVSQIRLSKDLGFNHKIAPSKLVVPCEACLIPNIPSSNDVSSNKGFRAFAKEPITVSAFLDEARVLPSLQKPRKLMIRGSDGKVYSVLAKPHDDLRKDQRLLEFDTMINRFLKRDINASKRRLYIRTYAVVPLNEECGLIEWVDGLKTMRDILLDLYRQRGVTADYAAIRETLDQICNRSDNKAQDFFTKVQSRFPPMLRQWFVELFPDPTTWFNARLRYARSCAVMSMVGHVLGLGDRHGENILFEQGNGGILHVDFNCLFDKGLTFEKPEMVPFRLTHNMIDAFGPYKVDGPFRRCCEITLSLLRSNEDALMTILETFLHDPTTDFMTAGKKRKASAALYMTGDVPDTPERMLEGVRGKVRGMLAGESVPLSVGGYVEEMVRRASDGENLARMYIGWCAFF